MVPYRNRQIKSFIYHSGAWPTLSRFSPPTLLTALVLIYQRFFLLFRHCGCSVYRTAQLIKFTQNFREKTSNVVEKCDNTNLYQTHLPLYEYIQHRHSSTSKNLTYSTLNTSE
ncbi:hypothetical protein TNIN_12881 [Trichonephila inaurata madagascariensis]|uniref:Uncharacterized protein n=1 Tax=Trichonephila inaurata madagascariensis TaxID=2747483 RepID=A0A8X7CMC4_9ARAC|nr:hypothetical protein TNIN_12881 [Trichonephila inaurata madagascariensis]